MNNNDFLHCGSMYKSELALAYNPDFEPSYARVVLNRWMARSPGLLDRLRAAGYTVHQKILTPAQVRLIIEALGEP